MAETCTCERGQVHCEVHGPEFSVMLYGQRYDFYTVANFARLIKRSASKLNRLTEHPARMKDEGRPLWCFQLYAQNLFPEGYEFRTPGGVPVADRQLTAKDFEGYVAEANGGQR